MDKYEFNIKIEQIKKLVGKGDYETAMKIAKNIDWKRVRNANLLSMVAQIYEKNEEYSEAKDILLLAFERAPIGKRLLYKLTELAVKEGNIEESEAYYREFCELASDDSRQHLLRYMILKEKGAPAEQLIHTLEQYTAQELDEKWLYELAYLYHEAGYGDECVKTCDRIMLMFGIGKYVDKAMELKTQYQPLTSYQMDLVENRDKYEAKLRAVENGFDIPDEDDNRQIEEREDRPETESHWDEDEQQEVEEAGFYEESDAIDHESSSYGEEWDSAPQIQEEEDVKEEPPSIDKILAARMREAEEEEKLARKLANIPKDSYKEDMPIEHTRVLTDIKSVIPRADGRWTREEESENGAAQAAKESAVAWEGASLQPEEEDVIIEDLWDDEEERPIHLLIEGKTPEEGFRIAQEMLKKVHRETGNRQIIAKITGSRLNKKGIFAVQDKIAGKDLVIEEAGDLSSDILNELNEFIENDRTGVVVALIDNPHQLRKLYMKSPNLIQKFEYIGNSNSELEVGISEGAETAEYQVEQQEVMTQASPVRHAEPMRREPVYEPIQRELEEEEIPTRPEEMEKPSEPVKKSRFPFRRREKHKEEEYDEYDEEYDGAEDEYSDDEYSDDGYEDSEYENDEYEDGPSNSQDDGREMDIDEFAEYACKYAGDIDCSITGKSMLALYERIEIMEEEGIPLTKKNAENLIEEAADKAEKPSIGKLITGVFSPKYNKDGLLILKEEHFI